MGDLGGISANLVRYRVPQPIVLGFAKYNIARKIKITILGKSAMMPPRVCS